MRRISLPPLRAVSRPVPTFRSRPNWTFSRGIQSAADLRFGQPLHETHPHLIKAGELTPGITALEYHHRRAALAQKLPRNSVAVLAANEVKFRAKPVFYEYYQDPNFYYLTGFNEPEAVAVIEKGESDVEYTFHLFVRPKDAQAEIWDGARSGVQAAQDVFNADEARDVSTINKILPDMVNSASQVYSNIDAGPRASPNAVSRFFTGLFESTGGWPKLLKNKTFKPLTPFMNELRLTKSEAELDCMRKAGSVSGAVVTDCMRRTYTTEKQLWADLTYGYKSNGLDGEAYVPVVAGGSNGLSIHYVRNDAQLRDGEMVLVDAGGQYGNYITDITRTWPVNGEFTDAQRDMYSMILAVQKSSVDLCREGANMSLDKLHDRTEDGLRAGLKDLGFDTTKAGCLDTLFPHHVGHYIGLGVHDAPGYPRTDRLKENQCITIEPGVYVPVDDDRWPAHFRGLGIRIEDSLRIGKDHVEVLTSTAIKEVEDIEATRA